MRKPSWLVALAALVAASTVPVATTAADTSPIKVGVVLSLSGPAAVFGIPERNAIETVHESVNRAGGVNGRQIQLIWMDDKTDPAEATRAVTQLTTADKVVAIIGPGTGGGILAAGPIAARNQTPLLAPAGTASITDKSNTFWPWIFRVAPADSTDIRMILGDMAKNGAKRIGILYQEDAYGKSGTQLAESLAKGLNLEIVTTVSAALNSTDLSSEAVKLRDAKVDSVFMQVSIAVLGANFVKAARQSGLNAPIYANAGLAQRSFIDAAGKAGDGTRVLSIGNLPYDPTPNEKRLSDMLIKAGKQPQGWGELAGSNGFMAVVAAAKTIKGEINGNSMHDALETLCGFPTYSRGKPCFTKDNHDGWGIDSLVVTELRDDKLISRK